MILRESWVGETRLAVAVVKCARQYEEPALRDVQTEPSGLPRCTFRGTRQREPVRPEVAASSRM